MTRLGGQPRIWRQRSPHAKQCRGALHGGVQGRGGSASTLLSEEVHPPELAYELNLADQTLRNWIERAEIARGEREGPTTEERGELRRSRWESKILREKRELLKKPYGALRKGRREIRRAHIGSSRRREDHSLRPCALQASWRLSRCLLCLEEQTAVRESPLGRSALGEDPDNPPQQPRHLRRSQGVRRAQGHRYPLRQKAGRQTHASRKATRVCVVGG